VKFHGAKVGDARRKTHPEKSHLVEVYSEQIATHFRDDSHQQIDLLDDDVGDDSADSSIC
jgi:hypothetical protein